MRAPADRWPRAVPALVYAVVALFCVVNLGNAVYKGGDFDIFVEAGTRVLRGAPLYDDSRVGDGVIGPPFQALFFTPFAALAAVDGRLAKVIWYGLNLACLFWAVRWWAQVPAGRAPRVRPVVPPLYAAAVLVPLFAVSLPLQRNFEHQNMNPLLLALLCAAALALSRRSDGFAGTLVGAAAALKAFPGLLIAYFALRGRWRAVAAACTTTVALTVAPLMVYGPQAYAAQLRRWVDLSASGEWPARGHNQSLFAAVDRLVDMSTEATRSPGTETLLFLVAAAALLIVFVVSVRPHHRSDASLQVEYATAILLAVLLSPIAWNHYWVLLFPGFWVAYQEFGRRQAPAWTRIVFWLAVLLTAALSRPTVGRAGIAMARNFSTNTIAAILLFVLLVRLLSRPAGGEPEADDGRLADSRRASA